MEEKEQRFKEFKARVLEAAHEAKACILSYRDAYNTERFENLCDVIKDNFWWCCRRGVVIAIDSAIVKAHGWFERVRVRIVDCNRLWIGRNRGLRAVYCKMQP